MANFSEGNIGRFNPAEFSAVNAVETKETKEYTLNDKKDVCGVATEAATIADKQGLKLHVLETGKGSPAS